MESDTSLASKATIEELIKKLKEKESLINTLCSDKEKLENYTKVNEIKIFIEMWHHEYI